MICDCDSCSDHIISQVKSISDVPLKLLYRFILYPYYSVFSLEIEEKDYLSCFHRSDPYLSFLSSPPSPHTIHTPSHHTFQTPLIVYSTLLPWPFIPFYFITVRSRFTYLSWSRIRQPLKGERVSYEPGYHRTQLSGSVTINWHRLQCHKEQRTCIKYPRVHVGAGRNSR